MIEQAVSSPNPNAIISENRITNFLYLLMRDAVVPGEVERLMLEVEADSESCRFSNTLLAAYAIELKLRLDGMAPLDAERKAIAVLNGTECV